MRSERQLRVRVSFQRAPRTYSSLSFLLFVKVRFNFGFVQSVYASTNAKAFWKDFLMTSPEFEVSRPDLSKVDLEDQDSDSLAGSGTMASSSTPGGQLPSNEALQPEKLVFITSCEMIRPMRVIKGVLEITNVSLKFRETPQSESDKAYAQYNFYRLCSSLRMAN